MAERPPLPLVAARELARCLRSFLVLVGVCVGLAAAQIDLEGPKLSPFRGMRAVAGGIEVQVLDERWFALLKLGEVDTATLLSESERLCGPQAWKRLNEDLPALFAAMKKELGTTVDLVLRDLASGEELLLRAVELTRENRRRLMEASRSTAEPPAPRATLRLEDARADLVALGRLLDEEFAYRALREVELARLLAEAALGADPVARSTLLRCVDRVLRAFGDGHSRVAEELPSLPVYLPFLVQEVAGGHVAFQADRSAFVDPEHPFLVAIDSVPLERWLAAARARGTQGSPAMQAREAERGLRYLGDLRVDLGLPAAPKVEVELGGKQGKKALELDCVSRRPTYGAWPRAETRLLEKRFGYLRLASMDDDAAFLASLDAAMERFRDTRGLVIDVRGNGGGTRDALRVLAPYFFAKEEGPRVVNVAALHARGEVAADALADRGLYPESWSGWSNEQRSAIARFAAGFRPSWTLPEGRFSNWRYLVLAREDNPRAFAYRGKVAVLIDRACFSATDVFAAALGEFQRVTLVGEATSGGSGRARPHRLPHSGIELQLSTMASFRPDGVLFEGHGVVPDLALEPEPGDLVGSSDATLERALELLGR